MINSFSTDESKTIAEHSAIISKYQATGFLDRQDAIKKYRNFNAKYQDFYVRYEAINVASNSSISIQDASDNVIVDNLRVQLAWLTGTCIS